MNIKTRLFPEGTVVRVADGKNKIMIVGLTQVDAKTDIVYDYSGVPYPQGYINGQNMVLFNDDQVSEVFHIGYLDDDVYDHMAVRYVTARELREQGNDTEEV